MTSIASTSAVTSTPTLPPAAPADAPRETSAPQWDGSGRWTSIGGHALAGFLGGGLMGGALGLIALGTGGPWGGAAAAGLVSVGAIGGAIANGVAGNDAARETWQRATEREHGVSITKLATEYHDNEQRYDEQDRIRDLSLEETVRTMQRFDADRNGGLDDREELRFQDWYFAAP